MVSKGGGGGGGKIRHGIGKKVATFDWEWGLNRPWSRDGQKIPWNQFNLKMRQWTKLVGSAKWEKCEFCSH